MKARGFIRSIYDPCVYIKRVSNSIFGYVILVLYVDDMLIVAKNQANVDQLKAQLSAEFKMKNLGKAKRILGMDIDRDIKRGKLWLTQTKYIERIVIRFNMKDAKPISLPLAAHFKLSHAQCSTTEKKKLCPKFLIIKLWVI
jgi:hypothetical protein